MKTSFQLPVAICLLALSSSLSAHDDKKPSGPYQIPTEPIIIGQDPFRFQFIPEFSRKLAQQTSFTNGHAIVQDARGRMLYLQTGKEAPLLAISKDAEILERINIGTPHGHGLSLSGEGEEQRLLIATNNQGGSIIEFSLDGEKISESTAPLDSKLYESPKLYKPAEAVPIPAGGFFAIDGYGLSYIHRYSAEGKWQFAFGGDLGEGEAQLQKWGPHGGALASTKAQRGGLSDEPFLWLGLSDQNKLKRFSLDGQWQQTLPLPGANPRDLIWHDGHWFIPTLGSNWPTEKDAPGFISVMTPEGKVVANLNGSAPIYEKGELQKMTHSGHVFHHPHGIGFDDEGNLYVCSWSSNGAPLMKFRRVRE